MICQRKAKKAYEEGRSSDDRAHDRLDRRRLEGADMDEQPRPQTTMEGLADLKTPFRVKGRVTAGNSSGLNDGAAGVLLASGRACEEFGLKPRMRMVGYAFAGIRPEIMGAAPIPATKRVLERTGMKFEDLDIIEANEAFA